MMLQGAVMPFNGPIRVMMRDPVDADEGLECMKTLMTHFTAPADGRRSVKALFDSLDRFDLDTRRHVHLENYVLFPRFVLDPTASMALHPLVARVTGFDELERGGFFCWQGRRAKMGPGPIERESATRAAAS